MEKNNKEAVKIIVRKKIVNMSRSIGLRVQENCVKAEMRKNCLAVKVVTENMLQELAKHEQNKVLDFMCYPGNKCKIEEIVAVLVKYQMVQPTIVDGAVVRTAVQNSWRRARRHMKADYVHVIPERVTAIMSIVAQAAPSTERFSVEGIKV